MSKKSYQESNSNERALYELSRMKYKDLQKACILKGMPFEQVVGAGAPALNQWFLDNYELLDDPKNLTEYDVWYEKALKEKGYKEGDAMMHPSLRMGYTEDYEKSDIKEVPKKLPKEPKEKREKDDAGMYKGTKKALTKECVEMGLSLENTIASVMERFPDANEKSIKIWYKKFEKK